MSKFQEDRFYELWHDLCQGEITMDFDHFIELPREPIGIRYPYPIVDFISLMISIIMRRHTGISRFGGMVMGRRIVTIGPDDSPLLEAEQYLSNLEGEQQWMQTVSLQLKK